MGAAGAPAEVAAAGGGCRYLARNSPGLRKLRRVSPMQLGCTWQTRTALRDELASNWPMFTDVAGDYTNASEVGPGLTGACDPAATHTFNLT